MTYGIRKEAMRRPHRSHPFSVAFLLLVVFLAIGATVALWKGCKVFLNFLSRETRYDKIIVEAGKRNMVDPALLKAVIWRESKYNASEIGGKGEIGLMQIMVDRAASDWARVKKYPLPSAGALYDPELNIEIGSWYLGRALRRWRNFKESVPLALCEYNAGLTRARKWQPETSTGDVISRIRINSTKQYVKDILKRYQKYKNEWKAPH